MTDDHVEGGRLRRFAKLAGAAARTTKDLLAAEAKRRILKQDAAAADAPLEATAANLVAVLGSLKGAATKLGQFVSLVDQGTFPEEARKVLAKLLSQTPHRMTRDQAGEVLARELGAPPEELFASFSEEPIAAASMGQVHAATLRDGRDVVVKIQYPGVEKSIESDLKNVALLAKGLSIGSGLLDGRIYLDEIAATLRRELDYREEARQLEDYRAAVRPWPGLVVPQVVEAHSAARVITLERLRGPTMFEFSQDASSPEDARREVAFRLVEAIWGPFLRERLIHADPHPGNYIVLDGGARLGVLDFGATKRLSVPFTLAYWRMVKAALAGGRADILSLLTTAGFEMRGEKGDLDLWLHALSDIVERPLRADRYDWEACRISADCRDYFAATMGTMLRCRAPAEGVMFYRAAAGAAGDFRLLKAKGDFRRALRELTVVAEKSLEPALREAGGAELFPA
jgi:predicted unusual protein kinase regulating ubiquinone biosynthesis (AarF/ABC1/UbiB family)